MVERVKTHKGDTMWYAVMHDTGKVIAEETTYREISDEAFKKCPWDRGASPYYLSVMAPPECSICYGMGKVSDGYEYFTCTACEGTGYSMHGMDII